MENMLKRDLEALVRRIEAADAVALGFARAVVPAAELRAAALTLANEIAAGPATSLGLTKTLVNSAYEPIEEFLARETMMQAVAFGSAEFGEGVDAFLGKRKPDFRSAAEADKKCVSPHGEERGIAARRKP